MEMEMKAEPSDSFVKTLGDKEKSRKSTVSNSLASQVIPASTIPAVVDCVVDAVESKCTETMKDNQTAKIEPKTEQEDTLVVPDTDAEAAAEANGQDYLDILKAFGCISGNASGNSGVESEGTDVNMEETSESNKCEENLINASTSPANSLHISNSVLASLDQDTQNQTIIGQQPKSEVVLDTAPKVTSQITFESVEAQMEGNCEQLQLQIGEEDTTPVLSMTSQNPETATSEEQEPMDSSPLPSPPSMRLEISCWEVSCPILPLI